MIVNGVTLPDVPVDVLAQYPYAVIVSQDYLEATGPIGYLMYATKSEILYASAEAFGGANATINSFGTGYEVYSCFSDGTSYPDKWTRMDDQCSEADMFSEPVGEYVINDNATVEYAIVWANHDIMEVTGFDPGTGGFLFGDTYFADSSIPATPSPTRYSIAKAILDDIAHAIQEKKSTTALFMPESMAGEIRSIASGGDLPNAEDASFGTQSKEYEYGITSHGAVLGYSGTQTLGYTFTPKELISIVGLSVYSTYWTSEHTLKIWDAETQAEIASVVVKPSKNEWVEGLFVEPINLQGGKKYMVTSKGSNYGLFSGFSEIVFNKKIIFDAAWYKSGDNYPTSSNGTDVPTVNLIIDVPNTESVQKEYKILTETLTSISDEVIRITSATGTLTLAQIITALNGIPVQAATTEE